MNASRSGDLLDVLASAAVASRAAVRAQPIDATATHANAGTMLRLAIVAIVWLVALVGVGDTIARRIGGGGWPRVETAGEVPVHRDQPLDLGAEPFDVRRRRGLRPLAQLGDFRP